MNKKLKTLNYVFAILLSVTVLLTIAPVIYCLTINTGDAWENFGYGIIGALILIIGITLALTECEIYSSVRYFVFSDRKSVFASLLHSFAIFFLLTWITMCVCTFVTDELALTMTISYAAIKLIHLIYFIIKKFLLKR